jgi:putative DeoR family transcriptional regulator, stage III sporulation protein D
MRDYIEERVLGTAAYIIETKATVREAAKVFGVSKSTVHKDMCERLFRINRSIHRRVRRILDENKAERHIRGGRATHLKYRGTDKNVDKTGINRYDTI